MSTGAIRHGDRTAREVSLRDGGECATTAAVQAIGPAERAHGMKVMKMDTQMLWVYDSASAAGAGPSVIVPTDAPATGRWLIHATGTGLAVGSVQATHLDGEVALVGGVGLSSVPLVIYAPVTAGITGAADDVIITTSVPLACRIVDVKAIVTTVGAGDTWILRDAAAGGGNLLSNAISVAVAGVIPWGVTTLPADLVAASDIYLRRTDDTTDGFIVITLLPA